MSLSDFCVSFKHKVCSKIFRVMLMFVLTISTAIIEIVYGLRVHSNALIADGLYSFAEGVCLIGVIIVLRVAHGTYAKENTFGYERLELLFGLIQEVFLLSVSLGIIVDAVNHLAHPAHVQDPILMIILGIIGIFVGLIGMAMFWGYHHDHDIEDEINTKKIKHLFERTKVPLLPKTKTTDQPNATTAEEANAEATDDDITPSLPAPTLEAFTYENVQIKESNIYATLHALCLHSLVVLIESVIVTLSGAMIKFIPHQDPVTGQEINTWLKYVDPCLTLIMVVIIAVHAVPVILSISAILIETVPGGIDTQVLMNEIVKTIPGIKSIHSFHIWRSTAKDIYATLHLVCDEDVTISTCTSDYGRKIEQILKGYCVRYFTLQFEYAGVSQSDDLHGYRCPHGLHRKRRGHTLKNSLLTPIPDTTVDIS